MSERRADAARTDTLRRDLPAQRRALDDLDALAAAAVELEPGSGELPALTRLVRTGLGHRDHEPIRVWPALSGGSAHEEESLMALFVARHEVAT